MKLSPKTAWNVAVRLQKLGMPLGLVNRIHARLMGE